MQRGRKEGMRKGMRGEENGKSANRKRIGNDKRWKRETVKRKREGERE